MYEGREVFPNAPVELVAVEVRFPDSARLRQPETLDALQLALDRTCLILVVLLVG